MQVFKMQSEGYMATAVVAVGAGSAPGVEARPIVVSVNPLRVHLDRVRTRAVGAWPGDVSTHAVAAILAKFVPGVGTKPPAGKDLTEFCDTCTAEELGEKLHAAGLRHKTVVVAALIHQDRHHRYNGRQVPAALQAATQAAAPAAGASGGGSSSRMADAARAGPSAEPRAAGESDDLKRRRDGAAEDEPGRGKAARSTPATAHDSEDDAGSDGA